MKQTVIIFTGLHHYKSIAKSTPKGYYDEEALMEVVNKNFPSDKFDVNVIDFPKCRCFFFGGDEKSVKNAHLYETLYPYTHYGLTDGKLYLCNGIENVMIFEAQLTKANFPSCRDVRKESRQRSVGNSGRVKC